MSNSRRRPRRYRLSEDLSLDELAELRAEVLDALARLEDLADEERAHNPTQREWFRDAAA
jgi:hypothetical protein